MLNFESFLVALKAFLRGDKIFIRTIFISKDYFCSISRSVEFCSTYWRLRLDFLMAVVERAPIASLVLLAGHTMSTEIERSFC